jgi:hypothetical protein
VGPACQRLNRHALHSDWLPGAALPSCPCLKGAVPTAPHRFNRLPCTSRAAASPMSEPRRYRSRVRSRPSPRLACRPDSPVRCLGRLADSSGPKSSSPPFVKPRRRPVRRQPLTSPHAPARQPWSEASPGPKPSCCPRSPHAPPR